MAVTVSELQAKMSVDQMSRSKFKRDMADADRTMESTSRAGSRHFSILGSAAKAAFFGVGAAAAIGGAAVIKTGIQFDAMKEQAQIAFTTMLGNAKQARDFLGELQSFAARTPFEFGGLVQSSQRLLAMGFAAKEVIPTLTSIGDAVAGLGGGPEVLDRVTIALGQMQAKGRASSEEMMQLTEAGIPAWKFLAQTLNTDVAGAMDMVTARQVDSKTAIKALTDGMNRDFGGMMEKQSHTLAGLWSTFKDTFAQISGAVIAPFLPYLKKAMEFIIENISAVPDFINDHLIPAFQGMANQGTGAIDRILEVAHAIWGFFKENLLPIIRDIARIAVKTFRNVAAAIADNRPAIDRILERLGKFVHIVWVVLKPILELVFERILPVALRLAIFWLDKVSFFIEKQIDLYRKVGEIARSVFNRIRDFVNRVRDAIGFVIDKVGFLGDAIHAMIDRVLAPLREIRDIFGGIRGAVSGAASAVGGFLPDGVVGASLGGFSGMAANPGGLQPQILDDLGLAQSMGLTLRSGYRPGAITSTGNPSLHAVGKAIDVSGSEPLMRAFFLREVARAASTGLAEIIHSPYWWHPGVGITAIPASAGTVLADHYNHVHVGSYDQGGYLRPGLNIAWNGTGRNEPVGFGGVTVNVSGSVIAERDLRDLIRKLDEDYYRRGGR